MAPMDDASLVEAARSGDGSAWAAIYDRYADRLHDHCHRILRDRDEAADALHDAFIAASRNLEQLRDPSRLRPWLYSICRHEALRRAKRRSRVELTDEVDEMSSIEVDHGRGARAEELQELVWSAAAGLNERDQALLDLNLRQGLEGQDLADAMGTSLNNSYVMLSRLRDQVERSLGALLVARLGRDDCDELAHLLEGWDGRFSPLWRKRVARHVDGCDVCSERRAAVVSPLALLAAAPLVPAPAALRDRILSGLDTAEAAPISFNREGFATATPGPSRRPRGAWLAAAAAALALVIGLSLAVDGDDATELTAAEGPTTTVDEDATTTSSDPTAGTALTSTTLAVAPPPTTGPAAPPPTTGGTVVAPTTTAPTDTTPPAISAVTQSASEIRTTSCSSPPHRLTVSAAVTDAVVVVLRWSGDAGAGEVPMSLSDGRYTASFGDFASASVDPPERWSIVATDAAGNESTHAGTVAVTPCPG